MNRYIVTRSTGEHSWCVRYEHTRGLIELKCFRKLSSAVKFGRWISNSGPSNVLIVQEFDPDTHTVVFRTY